MARIGRPPKPTKLKVLQGTDRPDRRNEQAPVADGEIGLPPDRLTESEAVTWQQVADAAFWLTDADRVTLERFCVWTSVWREAVEDVAEHGAVQRSTETGMERPSGSFRVMLESEKHLDRLGSNLGLDPASRTRIKVETISREPNPWDQFKRQ